jgi:hypothetical protein
MFIVEIHTISGPICESYETYEEAQHRINRLPAELLIGTPMIFKELADSSQRIVREDGKPLQFHRLPWDEPGPNASEPLMLSDPIPPEQGGPQIAFIEPATDEGEAPL